MIPKLIKRESEHRAALARIDELMSARPGTVEGDELELLVHLVESYEEAHHPIPKPGALAAIRFRMEQQQMRPMDLVPFLGSKSKVSEVLAGKRPLSLAMIRNLNRGLGIPAEVLLGGERCGARTSLRTESEWREFPLAEMVRRNWFEGQVSTWRELLKRADDLLGPFLSPAGMPALETVHLRRTGPARSGREEKALAAWEARVWHLSQRQFPQPLQSAPIDLRLIGEMARLSPLENGPAVAREMLAKAGIRLICEPRMPQTRLDGAAIRCQDGTAIIAMTLRYDRIDYFWFTLCHELAHLMLHLTDHGCKMIIEDLEAEDRGHIEQEADKAAMDAMIPKDQWTIFMKRRRPSKSDILGLAASLRLHPAIVAGRWRRTTGNYRMFSDLLGNGRVRQQLQ